MASQSEILNVVQSAMLPGDDVLNVVRKIAVILRKQPLLATIARAPPDKVPRRCIH